MRKNKNKGFSMVELIVVIAIMVVLLSVLAPSLLKYVENSRVQRDESAMDEVCNATQLALSDSNTFDEVFKYSVPNNYTTYSDSSGVYGAKYTDEEFWAPDGSGMGVTITFNPDEDGNYYLADGQVNNMTFSNGSVGNLDIDSTKQTRLEDMGDGKLYAALKKSIGTTVAEKSATYKNSSYTMFIEYELTNGIYRPTITGAFNGTNLTDDSPAAIGGNTTPPEEDNDDAATPPVNNDNNSIPDISDSDLAGGGSVGSPDNGSEHSHTPTEDDGNCATAITCSSCGIITTDAKSHSFTNNCDANCNNSGCTYARTITHTPNADDGNCKTAITCSSCGVTTTEAKTHTFTDINDMDCNNTGCIYTRTYVDFIVSPTNRAKVGYTDTTTDLVIPETFYDEEDGVWYRVTAISNNSNLADAFMNCTNLTSVTIPDSVTSIGHSAFKGCSNLTSVTIGNSVTSISAYVFNGCKNLTSIKIPSSVNEIGVFTFSGCTSLTSATFENTNGWRYSGWADLRRPTYIYSNQLSNPQTAAKYLRNYSTQYWGNY